MDNLTKDCKHNKYESCVLCLQKADILEYNEVPIHVYSMQFYKETVHSNAGNTKIELRVKGNVYFQDFPQATDKNTFADIVGLLLRKPRKKLQLKINGALAINENMVDAANGPKPTYCLVNKLKEDGKYFVEFHIVGCYNLCS